MIRTTNIKNGRIDLSGCRSVSIETFEKWTKRAKVLRGDVLLTREAPMGEVGRVNFDQTVFLGQRVVQYRVNPKKLTSEYLLYSFLSPDLQYQFRRHDSSGSTVSHIRVPDCLEFEIPLPSLDEQKKIASVLSALDAKIDCNNRINAELEAMAKTLYDYWFVQFDFPDASGKPYKSSGGKMVYNVKLKRDVPEGWQVLALSDVISRSGTGLNPRENFQLGHGNNFYVTIRNVTNGKITLDDKCDRVDDEALKIIDQRSQLEVGDVLFTSIEPVGVTYLIHKKPGNWNINESIFTIRPDYKKTTPEHLLCLLSSSEMKVFTKNSSTGSIHKGIRHGVLKAYPLAYGSKELIDKFSVAIKPMLKQMHVLENENQQLAQLRDWLLPLLMNGQVTVA